MLNSQRAQPAIKANRPRSLAALPKQLGLDCPDFFTKRLPARSEVDKGVPYTLEREHTPARNTQREADLVMVSEAVKTVDRTWDPGNQDCKAEDEASSQVRHLDRVESLEFQRSIRLDGPEA